MTQTDKEEIARGWGGGGLIRIQYDSFKYGSVKISYNLSILYICSQFAFRFDVEPSC